MALIFASPIPARILSSFLQNIPVHVSGSKNRVYHTAALFLYAFSALKKECALAYPRAERGRLRYVSASRECARHYKTLIVCSGVTIYAIFLSCFSVSNAGNNWNP